MTNSAIPQGWLFPHRRDLDSIVSCHVVLPYTTTLEPRLPCGIHLAELFD